MVHDHALNQIRRSLHDPSGSKVVLIVGAGFSKNAVPHPGVDATFPSWTELVAALSSRLYPDEWERDIVLRNAGATSSALRLAQEFQVAFTRGALVDFLRRQIPDESFEPSDLHRKILRLPWADVLTTNYDRFLERALDDDVDLKALNYGRVLSESDLPLARGRRLIKLHGTLPDLQGLVITEDDFRNYATEHAPFVNLVRNLMSENICCLIGFSGDDPNFLSWSGWVRDHLKAATPRLYWFTEVLPKPFQVQLLADRNIVHQ
jgi:hypothetical protein